MKISLLNKYTMTGLFALSMAVAACANAADAKVSTTTTVGGFAFSSTSTIAAQQKAVYDVLNQYQQGLDTANTKAILALFAPSSVAEWNNKRTATTVAEKAALYNWLFANEKFSTEFAYDDIHISSMGDMAFVRTHHHVGAAVKNIKTGQTSLDMNREVFILEKINGQWKIVLYTFDTDPVQGEA